MKSSSLRGGKDSTAFSLSETLLFCFARVEALAEALRDWSSLRLMAGKQRRKEIEKNKDGLGCKFIFRLESSSIRPHTFLEENGSKGQQQETADPQRKYP